ncbi:amidase family protein [Aestuariivirga litoralis]|uniref:amidase family protein n=1 Tax=Aestuariivirga litoralis TaxID=2650924 RepID=UPI0018C5AC9A|nr:amidase family protein [Aestuariivirga litoralis]
MSTGFDADVRARLALRETESDRLAHAVLHWDDQARGASSGPLAGLVMSIKANVDVEGWVTSAGSRVLRDEPVAALDAPLIASLRAAGAIFLAQTNMVEFAYGALGQNSNFGTPSTPVYPGEARLTGGSSSGAGVTVALGVVDAAVGTDTSGSVRIPAAWCGVAGFKPTQGRYSDKGIVPLALSLDTAGFLASSVVLCDRLDAAATGRMVEAALPSIKGLRFVVPRDFVEAHTEPAVLSAFNAALAALVAQGAVVEDKNMAYLADAGRLAREGGIVAAESFVWHQHLLAQRAALYDPRVGPRIAAGENIRAHDYIRAREKLALLAEAYARDIDGYAALLMPTIPIEPPLISAIAEDERYLALNLQAMKFTEFANRINVPSISLPLRSPGRAIGLMANGLRGDDVRLLQVARALEACLKS